MKLRAFRWPGGLDLAARAIVGAVVIVSGIHIATTRAPAAASTTPIPAASSAASSARGPMGVAGVGGGPEAPRAEEVAIRLTEQLHAATIEMPSRERGLKALEAHWRRSVSPWFNLGAKPEAAKLVQLVALQTSATETQYTVHTMSGQTIHMNVRQWNMNEGAYAQREAIVAPTPATIRFRVRIPEAASFDFAPALVGVGEGSKGGPVGEVEFVVRAKPTDGGAVVEIGRVEISERNRWSEKRFDLSKLAGKEVDLELTTDARSKKKRALTGEKHTAVALWGTPQIVAKRATAIPYNVLWIVVDSLRPDVVASFHDEAFDAQKRAAKYPPGYTLLPKIEGLTPNLDALAKRGTVYRRAITAGGWTRPGTVAMLAGVHSAELGVSPLPWALPDAQANAYYASRPPQLALAMRKAGVATRAFVNNNFMLGYATVGIDFGFEHIEDYRYRTQDTPEITKAALASMRAHAGERTFTFVNYNSPHDPYDPPADCLARIPAPEAGGPKDALVRKYMAEACKDDAAIGELMAELDREGLRDRTLVLVTADHGETLSEKHDNLALGLDSLRARFRHAFGHFEETTRIPLLLSLPGLIPEGKAVDARVTNLDIAPTIAKLEGFDIDPRQKGVDLIGVARGDALADRPLITMGRATMAVLWQHYRYVVREQAAQPIVRAMGGRANVVHELYDLAVDPGEEHDLVDDPNSKAKVAEGEALLKAATDGMGSVTTGPLLAAPPAKLAGATGNESEAPKIHVRFAGRGAKHVVTAHLVATGARKIVATPLGAGGGTAKLVGEALDFSGTTLDGDGALIGFDVMVIPAGVPITWTFTFDGKPLGDDSVYGGFLGVEIPGLARGLADVDARTAVGTRMPAFVDPSSDYGAFITRDIGSGADGAPVERAKNDAANAEVQTALKSWGYAK